MTAFYNINKIVDRSMRYSEFIKEKDLMRLSEIQKDGAPEQYGEEASDDTCR